MNVFATITISAKTSVAKGTTDFVGISGVPIGVVVVIVGGVVVVRTVIVSIVAVAPHHLLLLPI